VAILVLIGVETLNYIARDRGCEVHLLSSAGDELVVALAGREDTDIKVTGSSLLTGNLALVSLVAGYAANELAARRLRSPEKRKSHREAADNEARQAVVLAEFAVRLESDAMTGWCSGCFTRAEHHAIRGEQLPHRRFLCAACGTATTRCAAPRCAHLAVVKLRFLLLPRYCAAHRHEVPSFEKLDQRLASIDEAKRWLEFEYRNAVRVTKVAGGMIGAASIIGPMAFLAAPAVGAALGGSALGGGLTGAAATSHGLAMLGGGAIAQGGLGMAGGTIVVTATGTALGGALGATTATAYAGSDKSFDITKVRSGSGRPVIFAQGFLTESQAGWAAWQPLIDQCYADSPVFQLHWGAKELDDLAVFVSSSVTKVAVRKVLARSAKKGSKAFSSLPGIGAVLAAADLASNPWAVARARADMTGALLADLIARTDQDHFILLGHSLGARVMVAAARALGVAPEPKIDTMHLLGAAVGRKGDLRTLDRAVSVNVFNYFSRNDKVLCWAYSVAQRGERAAGFAGFGSKFEHIRDRDVSRAVDSHSAYLSKTKLRPG
jgi:pimeloyl-ACP methyl ester carboxylesterase